MENLSDELLLKMLTFVPPLELLRSTCLVSKRFASLLASTTFWHHHPACPNKHKDLGMNLYQIQCCCIHEAERSRGNNNNSNTPQQQQNVLPPLLRYQSLLPTRDEAMRVTQQQDFGEQTGVTSFQCCAASTTHHYGENLVNVLYDPNAPAYLRFGHDDNNDDNNNEDSDDSDDERNWQMWWSSEPSPSPDSTDTLLFACRYPLAILSKLRIKPLRDPHRQHTSYTWKNTIVRAYRYSPPTAATATTSNQNDSNTTSNNDTLSASSLPPSFVPFSVPSAPLSSRRQPNQQPAHLHHQHHHRGGRLFGLWTAPPDQDTIDYTLQGMEPVYESEPFAIPVNSNRFVTFDFSTGALIAGSGDNNTNTKAMPTTRNKSGSAAVVANLITIEMVGKNHEQFENQGYYSCVECVQLLGVPLLSDPRQAQHLLWNRLGRNDNNSNNNNGGN